MPERKKIKVLWSYRRFGVGGSETSALSIFPLLSEHFDITVLLTSGVGTLVPKAKELGIKVVTADMKGKLNRKRIAQGARFIAELAPDIVHIHSFDNHFMVRIAAILAGVPIIFTHHHTLPAQRYTPKLIKREIRLLPATDRVLFVCKAAQEQYWELVKKKVKPEEKSRLMLLYDAFDIEKLRASATDENVRELRQKYSIPPEARIIGTVARIHPVKNLELLIQAVAILRKKYESLKCFIVGEGDQKYFEKIRNMSNELGLADTVIFTGFQENVSAYYKLFEVTVLTSHIEGLPRSVIESYAVGTPVVLPRMPSAEEILDERREGFFAEPGSPQKFAQRIAILLANEELRQFCGECARARSELFTLQPYAERLRFLYETLLESPPPTAAAAKKKYRLRYYLTRRV